VKITDDDHQLLQKGLNAFQIWLDRWLLKLNIDKCKIAIYGSDINHEYKYYLSFTDLERVDVINNLGVVFDSELSFVSPCKQYNMRYFYHNLIENYISAYHWHYFSHLLLLFGRFCQQLGVLELVTVHGVRQRYFK